MQRISGRVTMVALYRVSRAGGNRAPEFFENSGSNSLKEFGPAGYRSDASILRTHSLLLGIAGVLIFASCSSRCGVNSARVARGVIAVALVATIGWDWYAVQWVLPQLMPIMTRGDVIAFADTAPSAHSWAYG